MMIRTGHGPQDWHDEGFGRGRPSALNGTPSYHGALVRPAPSVPLSAEHKAKVSAALKERARTMSPETREKMRVAALVRQARAREANPPRVCASCAIPIRWHSGRQRFVHERGSADRHAPVAA